MREWIWSCNGGGKRKMPEDWTDGLYFLGGHRAPANPATHCSWRRHHRLHARCACAAKLTGRRPGQCGPAYYGIQCAQVLLWGSVFLAVYLFFYYLTASSARQNRVGTKSEDRKS